MAVPRFWLHLDQPQGLRLQLISLRHLVESGLVRVCEAQPTGSRGFVVGCASLTHPTWLTDVGGKVVEKLVV
jgi:hypothetical protein